MSRGPRDTYSHPQLAIGLRWLRHLGHLTRQDVVDRVQENGQQLSESYLSEIERNKKAPSNDKLNTILEGLGTTRETFQQYLDTKPWEEQQTGKATSPSSGNYRSRSDSPLPKPMRRNDALPSSTEMDFWGSYERFSQPDPTWTANNATYSEDPSMSPDSEEVPLYLPQPTKPFAAAASNLSAPTTNKQLSPSGSRLPSPGTARSIESLAGASSPTPDTQTQQELADLQRLYPTLRRSEQRTILQLVRSYAQQQGKL